MAFVLPEDRLRTGLMIPVSKETFFNIKQGSRKKPPCAYDMLFHAPDYDPRAARSDRQQPQIIRDNIWRQELPKPISSTTSMMYGRPYWPPLERMNQKNCRVVDEVERDGIRINHVLEWAVLLTSGKPTCVNA